MAIDSREISGLTKPNLLKAEKSAAQTGAAIGNATELRLKSTKFASLRYYSLSHVHMLHRDE